MCFSPRRAMPLLFVGSLILTLSVTAQQKDAKDKVPPVIAKDTGSKALIGKDTTKPKWKPYKEVIPASAVSTHGLFSVFKVSDRYLIEIPDSLLGRDLLVVSRIVKSAAGPTPAKILFGGLYSYAGDEVSNNIIRFERLTDDKLFLKTVSYQQRSADTTNNMYWNLLNSNVQPIQAAFPIKTLNEEKKSVVIDMTDFINSDNSILSFPAALKPWLTISAPAIDRSYIDYVRAFPMNVEIRTVRTYNGLGAAPEPRTYELNSSIVLLPKVPMKGRAADNRVGFFFNEYVDFDGGSQGVSHQSNIWRWRMEPREEDRTKYSHGQLVEPTNPIVIYIDPLTPAKWVPYLIAGINDWQTAFEKAGFKNAIYGKKAPVGDSTWSMEDARHSVLVYKPSDIANASGPSILDPRSGEILETHINWYHNVMDVLYKWYFIQAAAIDPRARHPHFDDSLMGQLIRFVSSHEVGHTLGLMHNWGSSSTVPVDSLRSKAWVEAHGHTPSIMDYARFNYVAQPEDHIGERGIFPRIGDYDKWAIEWGYKYLPDTLTESASRDTLNDWILHRLAAGPQYFYGAQLDPLHPMKFDAQNTDPRDQNEDLGNDAVKAGEYGIKNLKRIEPHILEWTYEPHRSYDRAGEMYQEVVNQFGRYMGHALKVIGGVEVTPSTVDQRGSVFNFPSRERQKKAMNFLVEQLFRTPVWLVDTHLFSLTTTDFTLVANIQNQMLTQLLAPDRIDRLIVGQEQGTNAYTPSEMLRELRQGVFSELASGKAIEMRRRNLQKVYVERLCSLIDAGNAKGANKTDDALSILKAHARQLNGDIAAASKQTADRDSREHLIDLAERLHHALNPK